MVMATAKFKALVHYVVASCDDPHRLGATRLNKICWFADSVAYRLEGVSITGETYVKRQRGPVPKSVLHAIRDLEAENKIHVREKKIGPYKMRIFVALTEPDTSLFSPVEREIIDSVRGDICDHHTAASISHESHDQVWECANEGEEIPLVATLAAQKAELSDDVIKWADDVVERLESELSAA